MLSRVADAVYWMSRYVERAENVARYYPEAGEQWAPLVATTGDHELFTKQFGDASRDKVLDFLTFDRESPNSILSCLHLARENARSVREIISSEMFEQVNNAYLMVLDASRSRRALEESPHDFYTAVKKASQLFVGITYLTMSHNEPWHFCRLGRLLERADKTSRILDVKYFLLLPNPNDVGTTVDTLHWQALLRSASAFEMYRKRHGGITPNKVVDFLLLDRAFPRTVRYCLAKGERSLHAITGATNGVWTNPAEREMGRINAELSYADTTEILTRGLHEYIDNLQQRLNYVSDAVYATFFAMRPDADDDLDRRSAPPPLSTTRL